MDIDGKNARTYFDQVAGLAVGASNTFRTINNNDNDFYTIRDITNANYMVSGHDIIVIRFYENGGLVAQYIFSKYSNNIVYPNITLRGKIEIVMYNAGLAIISVGHIAITAVVETAEERKHLTR